MIMCCRQHHLPFVTVFIQPEGALHDRKLEIAVCPVCNALIAELTQFNMDLGAYEVIRPKRKHTAAFIKKMQQKEWKTLDSMRGTKGNMAYVYGVNREYKNGKIYQYAVDFNGTKKLVKIIE